MPPIDDGSPAVENSSAVTDAGAQVSDTSTTSSASDVSAPSSSAPQGETKESLLDAVLKAVPDAASENDPDALTTGKEDAPASTQPNSEDQAKAEQNAEPEVDLDKDPTKEELSRYHSKTRKRIEKLLTERNAYREDATVTKGLRDYLVRNDISKDDFQLTLDLATAIRKGDYRAFLEGVTPYVQLAQEALGVTLPQDLQSQVQQGYMTTEAAQAMSRERFARLHAEQNAQVMQRQQQQFQQVRQQEQAAQQRTQVQQSVEQAVSAWETSVRQTDPDYGRKESAVKNFLWAVVHERGAPQTADQAVEIAKEAYDRANKTFGQFIPPKQATPKVPSSVNRTAGARPEPKSMLEAAMLGLERAR